MAEHPQVVVRWCRAGGGAEIGAVPGALGSSAIPFHKHLWAKDTLQSAVNSQMCLKPDRHWWGFFSFLL